jgi:hypothetical protein
MEITEEKANKSINLMKALTSTKWGKQKETLITTYKTITRPIIEYGSTIWSPIVSRPRKNKENVKKYYQKLQTIQNSALRLATGCISDTNTQHLHVETKVLPIKEHLKLQASQLRQKAQLQTHPLNKLTKLDSSKILKRPTIFDNTNHTINYDDNQNLFTKETIELNKKRIHTDITAEYISEIEPNKVINKIAPEINKHEENLTRETRRILAQLRTNKSPILYSYRYKIDKKNKNINYPSDQCVLCKTTKHDSFHLFNCPKLYSSKGPISLWNDPEYVFSLLARWRLMGGLA